MIKKIIFTLPSKHANRSFLIDIQYINNLTNKPIVIFVHGFKGFKDWGAFNLVAQSFAKAGFIFVKLNLSHNGTTIDNPTEFVDLEAFGNNNFTIESDDIGVLIDHLYGNNSHIKGADLSNLFIIGHSRGGGLAIIKANEDNRVKKIATWSAISDIDKLLPNIESEKWKKDKVIYIYNDRTKQNMPLYYQIYTNYHKNIKRLNIKNASRKLKIPFLIIHGDEDETIPVSIAYGHLKNCSHAELVIIKGGNHTFNSYEPYLENDLPKSLHEVIEKTISFLNEK